MRKLQNAKRALANSRRFVSIAARAALYDAGGDDGDAEGFLLELAADDAAELGVEPVMSLIVKPSGVYLTAALDDGHQIHADDEPRRVTKRAGCVLYAKTKPDYAALDLLATAIATELKKSA